MLTIKAIPTRYAGVNFRSRLEARWAAFFDLTRLRWDYEPVDIEGWTPDFRLFRRRPVYAEVKPVDVLDLSQDELEATDWATYGYTKAIKHKDEVKVVLLGNGPRESAVGVCFQDGRVLHFAHKTIDLEPLWREAGNLVQWKSPEDSPGFERLITQLTRIADVLERKWPK